MTVACCWGGSFGAGELGVGGGGGGCGCGCEEGEGEGEEGGEVHCVGVGGWEFVAFDQVRRKPGELASLGSGVIWC